MYAQYGSYVHEAGEAWASMSRDGMFVDGMSKGFIETWNLNGQLHGTDAADLTTKIGLLHAAYSRQAQNFGFYNDDTTATALYRASSACLGGLRVTRPVSFGELRRAEYTTFVNYTIALEGEVFDSSVAILSWQEEVHAMGGGPLHVMQTYLNGPPQKQTLYQQTPYMASQQGSAVGYLGYPSIPPPLWPSALLSTANNFGGVSPRRVGAVGNAVYQEFPISWSYSFISDSPLIGYPHFSPQR